MGLTLLLLRARISNEGHRKTEWRNRISEVRRSSAARMCSGPLADDALMIVARCDLPQLSPFQVAPATAIACSSNLPIT
jgi:hypothetical protein